eukprot:COSAG01_NODE_3170_length_6472_cov_2.238820_2_plen_136_part_00
MPPSPPPHHASRRRAPALEPPPALDIVSFGTLITTSHGSSPSTTSVLVHFKSTKGGGPAGLQNQNLRLTQCPPPLPLTTLLAGAHLPWDLPDKAFVRLLDQRLLVQLALPAYGDEGDMYDQVVLALRYFVDRWAE